MNSNMHFKDIKSVASMSKSNNKNKKRKKTIKYMKNENIIIKTNIHIQYICLTDFVIKGTYRTNYALFPINTLNLKGESTFFSERFCFQQVLVS